MRLLHVSDLHLGRTFNEVSLVDDQRYLLQFIIKQIEALKADVLLISGDIYDKNSPSERSFELWSDFLEDLQTLNIQTFVISGNHDSAQRLSMAPSYLKAGGVHLVGKYRGEVETLVLEKQGKTFEFALIPFVRPAEVRNFHDDFKSQSYHEAMGRILRDYNYDKSDYHILLSHQFVIDGSKDTQLSDSEVGPMVGGIDAIHAHLFDKFDYVALGHIHKPQMIRKETIRYSGSPLKYSISEAHDQKQLVIIDIEDDIHISFEPITPLRDVRILKGNLQDLMDEGEKNPSQDLVHAILLDDEALYEPMNKLQSVYPNCVSLELKPQTKVQNLAQLRSQEIITKDPLDLIESFYEEMLGKSLDESSKEIVQDVVKGIDEGDYETN